jgi:hypothetical protein
MELFVHTPHPHVEARKATPPPKVRDQMPSGHPLARLNTRIGLIITIAVGSMWCAYLFTLLALISLPAALSTGDKIVIVAWIAQTFLQLVLLPIIIVGQNVQAMAADKRAEQTYKDAEAVLHEALEIQRHLHAQDHALVELMARLEAVVDKLGIESAPVAPAALAAIAEAEGLPTDTTPKAPRRRPRPATP